VPARTSADTTYDQTINLANAGIAEADQELARIRSSRLKNIADGLAGLVNDPQSMSRASDVDDALREQERAAQQTLEAITAFRDGHQRDHGGINEAHQSAPIPIGAQPEYYQG
jgi:hypothetical protein